MNVLTYLKIHARVFIVANPLNFNDMSDITYSDTHGFHS